MLRLTNAGRDWYQKSGRGARAWAICAVSLGLAGALVGTTSVLAAAQPSPSVSSHRVGGSSHDSAEPTTPGMAPQSAVGGASSSPSHTPTPHATGAMPGVSMGPGAGRTGVCPSVVGATVMPDGMVMAPVPARPPTPGEQAAAANLVSQVTAGTQQFANLAVAEARGYRPAAAGPTRGPFTHYIDPTVVASHDVLDPAHPSALMYANTVAGPVLVGAMFLGPAPCQPGPDIGGPLTDWHAHDDLCLSRGVIVGNTRATGSCMVGTPSDAPYFMLHVWTAPSIAAQYQFQADVPASAFTSIIRTGQQ